MTISDELLKALRTWRRMPAGQVLKMLGVSRPSLMRAVRELGPQIITRGRARRTSYAASRALRGQAQTLPLYRIDTQGQAHQAAMLQLCHPAGCAIEWLEPCEWPLDEDMQDGWFDGLPYFLDDLRPQGFLGRGFARHHAAMLQVSPDPAEWSEDDTLYALNLLGIDQPGHYVLGEPALRQWLTPAAPMTVQMAAPLPPEQIESAYPRMAEQALAQGQAYSSAAGEFPKFTALRELDGQATHVIVKFSGSDDTPGTVRWADLLICEHLALQAVASLPGLSAAHSQLHQAGGRTFLEVQRFDRHGLRGRSPVCSWAALNAALLGLNGRPWPEGGAALRARGLIDADTQAAIERLWLFGQLIANTDMHDRNLSFRPGLTLAPVYDMLPMAYAPVRGVELPMPDYRPLLPLPAERSAWQAAAHAAEQFWAAASADPRISAGFRALCARNAAQLRQSQQA